MPGLFGVGLEVRIDQVATMFHRYRKAHRSRSDKTKRRGGGTRKAAAGSCGFPRQHRLGRRMAVDD